MGIITLKNIAISTVGFMIIFLVLSFTKNSSIQESNSAFIPTLLDRPEKTRMGIEWDQMQNTFVKNRDRYSANNENYDAGLNLAFICIKEARITGEHGHYYPSALNILDDILSKNDIPVDAKFRALTSKAGVLLSLHEFKKAKDVGEEAIKLNQSNAQIYGVLVDAHVELGEYDKEIMLSDKMVSTKPDLRSYARVSYLREIHGDVDGAIEALKMAVKAGFPGTEESAWAMLTLGELYQKYDQPELAKNIYEQILIVRPNYPFAVGGLADIEYQHGNLEEAERIIKNAMDIIPEVGFYIQMAQIYKDQRKTQEYESIIAEILEMLKDDTDHGHNMNMEYADLFLDIIQDNNKAFEYAAIELDKRPENIDVNLAMAKVKYEMGEFDSAKEHLLKASKTNAKFPDLMNLKSELSL